MTQKTAMQEVLDKCCDETISFEELGRWVSMSVYMLLEKEKQQIVDARRTAPESIFRHEGEYLPSAAKREAEDYYNQTYNQ